MRKVPEQYVNPSAGKFEAPPPPRDPLEPTPFYKQWWFTGVILLAYYIKYTIRSSHTAGAGLIAVLLGVGLQLAHHLQSRSEREDPYSPPTRITR